MLFHTMVGSNDIERSKQFYNAVLGALGIGKATLNIAASGHTRLFYRNEGGTNFIVTEPINDRPATVANGSTVAFSCDSPEQVELFHATAIANGGTSIEELPGPRASAMGALVWHMFATLTAISRVGSTFLHKSSLPKVDGLTQLRFNP